ncbi:MAG: hypothetical protein ACYDCL_13965 [Myxococcales bacterium]
MKRLFAAVAVLTAVSCGTGNCGQLQNSSDLCDQPFGVGPDYTLGECAPGAICLPSTVAPCAGNDCCHAYCAVQICPPDTPCLTLTPSQFPDGGVRSEIDAGCDCDGTSEADAGCVCDDGGCMWSSCLAVCSAAT